MTSTHYYALLQVRSALWSDAEPVRSCDNGQLRLLDARHVNTRTSSSGRVHQSLVRVRSSRHVCFSAHGPLW